MSTDVEKFVADLGAGVFEEKLSTVLSQVALAVSDRMAKGKIDISLELKPMANGAQVVVKHSLKYTKPTLRGNSSEVDTTETLMYVGKKGSMTLYPEDQTDMFRKRSEAEEDEKR